jgi:hypothetical protein
VPGTWYQIDPASGRTLDVRRNQDRESSYIRPAQELGDHQAYWDRLQKNGDYGQLWLGSGGIVETGVIAFGGFGCGVKTFRSFGQHRIPKIYYRPGWRKHIRPELYEQEKGKDGLVRDPKNREVIPFDSNWQLGHKPGYEFWRLQDYAMENNLSRQEFIELYNSLHHLRPETKKTNESHFGESDWFDPFLGP